MNNEIKEIPQIDATLEYSLEDFMEAYKMIDEDKVYSNGTEFVPIFRVKQWLDYNNITNLQEENIRLKELCDKYEEEHKTAFKLWKQEIEKIPTYEEKIELVDRINKATEYIKEKAIKNCWIDQYEANDLLNILNGSDKE